MNKPQPSLQAAVVTGLNLLGDPEVRIPANQAEGIAALRMLLQAIASGQLVVSEPTPVQPSPAAEPAPEPVKVRKARAPRQPKANGAAPPAAPTSVQ